MRTDQQARLYSTLREAGGIAVFGAVLLFVFTHFGFGIPCLFRTVTGLLCPGCGMTHALAELVQGHVHAAIEYNALSVSVLPLTALYLVYRKVRYIIQGDKISFSPWEYVFLVIMLFTAIAYCIWHNFNYF